MKTILFSTLLASVLTTGAFAQSEINRRRQNQQDRIANGVQSGALTAGETANLEKKESNIDKEIRNDRAQNGGHLTAQQKRQVNRQQNRVGNRIYRDNHNGA